MKELVFKSLCSIYYVIQQQKVLRSEVNKKMFKQLIGKIMKSIARHERPREKESSCS